MQGTLPFMILIMRKFLKVCVHACIFGSTCAPRLCGLCVCIIVFSARLAMPVCSSVQVAHDPDSIGRPVFHVPCSVLPQNLGQRIKE